MPDDLITAAWLGEIGTDPTNTCICRCVFTIFNICTDSMTLKQRGLQFKYLKFIVSVNIFEYKTAAFKIRFYQWCCAADLWRVRVTGCIIFWLSLVDLYGLPDSEPLCCSLYVKVHVHLCVFMRMLFELFYWLFLLRPPADDCWPWLKITFWLYRGQWKMPENAPVQCGTVCTLCLLGCECGREWEK